jgi:hypothetical protein
MSRGSHTVALPAVFALTGGSVIVAAGGEGDLLLVDRYAAVERDGRQR